MTFFHTITKQEFSKWFIPLLFGKHLNFRPTCSANFHFPRNFSTGLQFCIVLLLYDVSIFILLSNLFTGAELASGTTKFSVISPQNICPRSENLSNTPPKVPRVKYNIYYYNNIIIILFGRKTIVFLFYL